MTVQHSAITEAQGIHEPKGVSTASSGMVYIANGAGSGTWVILSRYGELYIDSGATTQALTTTAALLNPGTEWTAGEYSGVTLTAANGSITFASTDKYVVNFWCTFDTDSVAAGTIYTFYYAVNGVISSRSVAVQKLTAGVDRLSVAAMGFPSFTSGQILTIFAKSSTASTITVREAGLSVHKL